MKTYSSTEVKSEKCQRRGYEECVLERDWFYRIKGIGYGDESVDWSG